MKHGIIGNKRRSNRIAFARDAGVYCTVSKEATAGKAINLMVVDISEKGFRFTVVPGLLDYFAISELVFLSAIAGARVLHLTEPLELLVRRHFWHKNRKLIDIGCEIVRASEQSQNLLKNFILAENETRRAKGPGGSERMEQRPAVVPEPPRSMKITTIFAGHRSNGNTARVLGWVEERLKGLGHRVERINLGSKKINGCSNCLRCNGGDCVQEDDGNPIIQRMAVSDAVIFASPLYHKYLSSQLKALLERLGGFRGHADKNGLPAAGQPQALIMTISSIFDAKAWQCLESFEQALQRCKARCAGKLIVCNCSSPDLLNGQTRTMANALAEELFFRKNAPFSLLISEPRLRNRIAPADGQPF